MENNKIKLIGILQGKIDDSRELDGEKFFDFNLEVKRLSGVSDIVPVTVPEKLFSSCDLKLKNGMFLEVEGEVRYHNKLVDGKSKLMLFAFAKNLEELSVEEFAQKENTNSLELKGTICKLPVYRTTPFGKEIADVILAVNRNVSTKSDYLPLIAWGRNARYLASLEVGTKIAIEGRVQSRIYEKKTQDEKVEKRVAYEVSVAKLDNISKLENAMEEGRDRA